MDDFENDTKTGVGIENSVIRISNAFCVPMDTVYCVRIVYVLCTYQQFSSRRIYSSSVQYDTY